MMCRLGRICRVGSSARPHRVGTLRVKRRNMGRGTGIPRQADPVSAAAWGRAA